MSSDWFNLFVHQGREFIDSVSRKGRDGENSLTSGTKVSSDMASRSDETVLKFVAAEEGVFTKGTENETERSSEVADTISSKEPITGAEKDIYETQLEQLQAQLVDIMIQNNEMAAELDSLRNSDVTKLSKELEKEQSRTKKLEEKLQKMKNEDGTPKLRKRKGKRKAEESFSSAGTSLDYEVVDEGDVPISEKISVVSLHPDLGSDVTASEEKASRFQRMRLWLYTWYTSLSERATLQIWDIISDLADEETPVDCEDTDGPPLSVKTLRDNIRRFGHGIKPISEFFKKVSWVLSWKNPAATMLIFFVYLFAFWHGYFISTVIFLAIVQLSANFIYSRFGSVSVKDEGESPSEHSASWSDKFQIVLHVARKVQNVLGYLSDHLEKIRNLFMWKIPHVTFKLYITLWILLITSVVLNGPQFFTLVGMFAGYKLFITNPLYQRFPKLRKKYDTTLRLWNELPVDSEPLADGRSNELEESHESSAHQPGSISHSDLSTLSSQLFCARYKLTTDEVLVRGWEEGWRTSLMNKHKPLVNIKHGRLYLTQNYLCFERSRTNIEKNILLKLYDFRSVKKYKPLSILPGTGMSIEVCVKDRDEPYIFAAMVGRDEAYNDIMRTGKEAGLSWAI